MTDKFHILIKEIELRFGRELTTPTDFNLFLRDLKRSTGESIGLTTMKRLWGYIKSDHSPSYEVKSILAKYIGYKSWDDFINSDMISDNSGFVEKDVITSSNLKRGDELVLWWAPRRKLHIVCIDEGSFKVLESENSKLSAGDTFHCPIFAKSECMICTAVIHEGHYSVSYIAARTRGLANIEVRTKDPTK